MKNSQIKISLILFSMWALYASAEVKVNFDKKETYGNIGMYDVWENSPFRTGELKGNWAVTANPDLSLNEETGLLLNPSGNVLGAQRSRFGSNRFGVKIDLTEPWKINPSPQYVHVLLYKPKPGRVMLVGLGSRNERLDQNPYTEQFWELSSNMVGTDQWFDAVFPVKGADGVNIRSLVVVPDCESPHNLKEDFLFYVGDIEINDSPEPRINRDFYPIAGIKESTSMDRSDKYAVNLSLASEDGSVKEIEIDQRNNKLLYQNLTNEFFHAKPGETVTPKISYVGPWMHSYCYVDYDGNGTFAYDVNENGTPASGSEIVAYNYFNGKDSKAQDRKNPNLGEDVGILPAFTVPQNLAPGVYRMRFKVDWNAIDPMGNQASDNRIADNGGLIADVMLMIDGEETVINDFQLNGEVVAANGEKLNSYKAEAGQPFTIKVNPEKGFHNGGVIVKTGYHLNNDEIIDKYGNPQYLVTKIEASEFNDDGTFTIPAELIHGNVLINGIMIENSK